MREIIFYYLLQSEKFTITTPVGKDPDDDVMTMEASDRLTDTI